MSIDHSNEQITRSYSHDYQNDTSMTYSRSGTESTLRLSFSSEDPDMGTEELFFHGIAGEDMMTLASDLLSEIVAYLDFKDSSSFYIQQGISDGIHSQEDFYGEYSRTALYAFEGALKQMERDRTQEKPLLRDQLKATMPQHSSSHKPKKREMER